MLRRARRSFAVFTEYAFGLNLADHHNRWAEAVEREPRLVILAPVEHGKSTLLSIAFPLWLLGTNPNARIALVSETQRQAVRPLASIREHIVRNPNVKEVFPALRPASGAREKWSDSEILVERDSTEKEPSVIALGVTGPLLGARLDLAILDDVCSFDNTFTHGQRSKLIGWFRSTLVGRIVADGRVVVVGTPWHSEDLLHELERSGEYQVLRDPAMSADGEPLWPERWSTQRLAQRRREIGEVEFSRQMLLQAIADETARFKQGWFERAFAEAGRRGLTLVDEYRGPHKTFTGVDLGVGQDLRHDESVLFTVQLLPDNTRVVLNIESGRWQAPELVRRLKTTQERFRSRLRVETNAAQAYIAQFLEAVGARVDAHVTGRNRHDPLFGIESLAVELEQGRWLIPGEPRTRAWVRELLAYSPTAHAGDRVIASWLAREAARHEESLPHLEPILGQSDFIEDPFDDGTWVLGPSKPAKRQPTTTIPGADGVRPPSKPRPPFIVR